MYYFCTEECKCKETNLTSATLVTDPYGHSSILECESSILALFEDMNATHLYGKNHYLFLPGEFEVWT